ncbi:MAG: hypothetical protein IIA14_16400 [SAR324 cluster bacterium]|nr:hypothetical protein [SAR324 cluster bacterium]
MTIHEFGETSGIIHPPQPLPRKYIEPILFLAERMSMADGMVVPKERRMIEILAEAAGTADFREKRGYPNLTERRACEMLDEEEAKMGALVVISLVLKADFERKGVEQEFFHKIRKLLEAEPITVPVEFEAHKQLALQYIKQ